MKKYLHNFKFLTLALGLMLIASVANAQTRTASVNGNWNSTVTWGGLSVPTSANDVVINDNITVTVNVNAACASLTINGGANSSTVNINTGFTLDVTTSGGGTGAITYGVPTDNSSDKIIALLGATSVLNCVSITMPNLTTANDNTILNVNDGTATVSGNITMAADAANENTVDVNNGILRIGGSISTTGDLSLINGSTIEYNGTAQTVRGTSYSNLILSGSGSKTTTGVTVVDKLTLAGTATVGNAITYSTAILEYGGGAAQTTSVNEFPASTVNITEVIINKSAGTVTLNAAKTLNADLTLTAGTLATGTNLTMEAGTVRTITVDGGSMTGTIQGTVTNDYDVTYIGGSKTTGAELSGVGFRSLDVDLALLTDVLTLDQNRSPDGDVLLNNGVFDLSTFTINRSASGGEINITNNSTLRIGGTNSFPSNYTNHTISNGGNATVEYAGAAQSVIAPIGETYAVLVLSGSGVKTLAAGITVDVRLLIQGTATTAGTTPTYAAAAVLEYKGSVAQTISNVEFVGTGANPTNLTIDNTSGVTLLTGKTINGTLALINGYLTTTGVLLIGNAGNATTTNGAFVNGQLNKSKNTTTLFTFPVGNLTGGLRTVGVTPQNTTTTIYGASFISADPRSVPNGTALGGIQQISACEYWNVSQVVGAGSTPARVTLSWPAAANSCGFAAWGYITNAPTLLVAHHNGTNWVNEGQSSNTVVSGSALNGGTVTSNTFLTSFSPFTIGTTNGILNPLPVTFSDVKAFEKGTGVQIEWTNLTEKDVLTYTVERSANGRDFTSISQLGSRSNQSDKQSYLSFDGSPLSGTNYYRIKVLEADGKIILSKILKVDIGRIVKGISLYPNPVPGSDISITFAAAKGQYTLRVINNAGQEVYSKQLVHPGGSVSQSVELPASLKTGVYNLMISGDSYRETKMFIMQ